MRNIAWTEMVKALLNAGMQQKHIAERVGCGRATVSRWANGMAVPAVIHHSALIDLFEENATIVAQRLIAEIGASDELAVLLDSRDRLVAISPGLINLMTRLGIQQWSTRAADNGLMRIVTIKNDEK